MNVFIVAQGQDTGGQGQRTAAAFRKYTDWTVNFMCAAETYIKYPIDVPWDFDKALQLYREADVVQHQNWLYGYVMYEYGDKKPTILQHHGTPLREDPVNGPRKEARSIGATQIVSTVDLLDDCPEAIWTPAIFDLDWIAETYKYKDHGDRIRIGHGPTVRASKGTEKILKALNNVCKNNRHVEVDLIEGVPWSESLRRKSNCDIWIDQLTLGYGNSTIEAMAMSIPVITGWSDPKDPGIFQEQTKWGMFPFKTDYTGVISETGTPLEVLIQDLIDSKQQREEYGHRGRMFAEQFHSEERGVEQLKEIYQSVPMSKGLQSLVIARPFTKNKIAKRWRKNGSIR